MDMFLAGWCANGGHAAGKQAGSKARLGNAFSNFLENS
jgi:hypothetical protein